jgi:predicted  nucleic acid-binding Zn-ribbon protein
MIDPTEYVNRYLNKLQTMVSELIAARVQADIKVELLEELVNRQNVTIQDLQQKLEKQEKKTAK